MADASEHAATVLSAIVPGRRDLLDKALLRLTPAHFPEKVQANLFQLLERYAEVTAHVMTPSALEDLLRTRDSGQALLYTETYSLYSAREVTDADFLWSVEQLRELAAEKATGEVITESMEILRQGKSLPSGETVKGHHDARAFLLEAFSNIDLDLTMQEAPEGDIRHEQAEILKDYADRKRDRMVGLAPGILTGVPSLDEHIGGFQNGELVLSVGYSSDGKTSLCVQIAWSAAVEQGKNVVFFTTETLRPQVRRKLLSRHSKLPLFGLPDGLDSHQLKLGTLPPQEESRLPDVVSDFTHNPAYGRLYLAQVPRHSTISSLEQRLYRIERSFQVDLVVCDYLALLKSDRKRNSDREEFNNIVKEAKQVATTFADGRGVPFLSPWQVNREKRDAAEKLGYYTTAALAETSEATNSADVILSILAPNERERHTELTGQVMKNRDGKTAQGLRIMVDYATSTFESIVGVTGRAFNGVQQNASALDYLSEDE